MTIDYSLELAAVLRFTYRAAQAVRLQASGDGTERGGNSVSLQPQEVAWLGDCVVLFDRLTEAIRTGDVSDVTMSCERVGEAVARALRALRGHRGRSVRAAHALRRAQLGDLLAVVDGIRGKAQLQAPAAAHRSPSHESRRSLVALLPGFGKPLVHLRQEHE